MKIKRIDHIAIALECADEVAFLWREILGFKIESEEVLEKNGVKVYIIAIDSILDNIPKIEMMEPYGEKSPIINFLKKRGRGIHHICFETEDIKSDMEELNQKGIKLLSDKPIEGADDAMIVFINPSEFGGILVELKQYRRK